MIRTCLLSSMLLALLVLAGSVLAAGQLNDTGQITCYNDSDATGTVSIATPDPEAIGFNEQDCTRGSAAADALGKMVKLGGSTVPGRDYTKIANDGSELPSSAALGPDPGDWACTRDNRTGLMWEVKVNDPTHLRHFDHRYTWYDANPAANGGNAGKLGSAVTCNNTLPLPNTLCNTSTFRDVVNMGAGLCGATDWRMPTGNELQSLMHYGVETAPPIDVTWFPNTKADTYWTSKTYAPDISKAWAFDFRVGIFNGQDNKSSSQWVRLVRGGQ